MKNFLTNTCLLILLFQCYIIKYASAQADAGKDKVIAKGKSGTLIGGKGDPSWCYSWTPTTGLNDSHILNPTANPDKTTTYTLKIVGPNFQFTAEDDMKVFVIEDLKLEVENNITECMEDRTVTYTAKVIGDLSGTLPDKFEFIFHYKKANGTEWTDTDWSFGNSIDNTVVADKVLDGDTDHKFSTPIYAEVKIGESKLTSNTLNIDVYELWIDYVRYDQSHPWKVVVGEPFNYSAISSKDCLNNWNWDMEDGLPDTWNPTGGSSKIGSMSINNSDLPTDDKWYYFGDKYGTVNVKCEDEEGNKYKLFSTNIPDKPNQVMVFFDRKKCTNPTPPQFTIPKNWFYYWKSALFGNISNVFWSANTYYMECRGNGDIYIGERGNTDYDVPFYNNHGYPRPSLDGKSKIDFFYSALTHELKHREDFKVYDQVPDTDGDHLPDIIDPFPTIINGVGYPEYVGIHLWEGDWEQRARSVENVFAPANKDWSKEGKQW